MWRRARSVPLLVAAAVMCSGMHGGRAAASDARQQAPVSLRDAITRPHLETPAVPEPHALRLPDPTSSHLLLSSELQVPARVRLMIFAPHPDDETLGAGGLIQRVLQHQGAVQVVFVTNGDGYVDGVRREVHRRHTSHADFIEYGERRHQEATRALHDLGLRTADGVFLGFPDDGIDDLWAGHWSVRKPYTSPYTRFDRPLYKGSLSQRVEYAGSDLESEIVRTLREFRPDWVLMPDPRDRHPDHCTTGVFVLDALRKLRQEGVTPFGRTQVLTYLIHSPDYPASPAWVKEIDGAGVGGSRTAGRILSAARWLNMPLSSAELANKRRALSDYESQIQVLDLFMKQFLRPFELFGQLDAAQVTTVPRAYASRFHR